uniref:BRCT domain-containing protein n=1 Tax=Macrostomum lignano TaxID=282301 RepID=A0A1I8FG54_9PLAT
MTTSRCISGVRSSSDSAEQLLNQLRRLDPATRRRCRRLRSSRTLSSGARVPLAKLELRGAGRLGYRFTAGELAELRNSVGGGGSGSVPFGQFVAAVSDIIGRRGGAGNQLEIEEAVVVPAAAAATSAAAPPSQPAPSIRRLRSPRQTGRRRQRRGEATAVCRCYVDIDWLADCADRPGQDAAVAAASLRPANLPTTRRLDDAEAAIERDRRRLAVLAGELRKSGRHSNRLATALAGYAGPAGPPGKPRPGRAGRGRRRCRAGRLSFDGNDDAAASWEPAQLRPGVPRPPPPVFANHAEGRGSSAAAGSRGNSKRAEQEAEPEVDGAKSALQRYRMDILDRNGV